MEDNTGKAGHKVIAYSFTPNGETFPDDKWDFGFLNEAFNRNKIKISRVNKLRKTERAFVVIPGFEWQGLEEELNKQLSKIGRLVLFITADEQGVFDADLILHSNAEIWIQYPYPKHSEYNTMPVGTPYHKDNVKPDYPNKINNIYFSGQITHQRRRELATVLPDLPGAVYRLTEGFTQGETPRDYYKLLSSAKIAPAPAGVASIDTFRFYECLEMLCLPVADSVSSSGDAYGFWEIVFASMPIPQVSDWNELSNLLPELLSEYPANMHKAVSWWIKYKRDFSNKIMEQIYED